MVSRFEIVDEEYIEELKDWWKWEHEEKHGALQGRFQKVGEGEKLQNKLSRVWERCPRPNTVPVLRINIQ